MNMDRAVNIDDLRLLAKRRMPKIAFDFIEGGVEDEDGLSRNERMFQAHRLVPRYLIDVSKRDLATTVLGVPVSMPVLVAPTAFHGLACDEAELATARAAADSSA